MIMQNLFIKMLKDFGLRVDIDLRNEKIGYRSENIAAKVPFILAVGTRRAKTVALRQLESQPRGYDT